MNSPTEVISEACRALSRQDREKSRHILSSDYPFDRYRSSGRRYSDRQRLALYIRDGFIDRYSGDKLVFLPALRILSREFPGEFPYHPNWKMSECHIAYWRLTPTIDHIVPVARGGEDIESNWVCTSQLRNSAKSNWLLEEIGWELFPSGDFTEWDGLLNWYQDYVSSQEDLITDPYFGHWYRLLNHFL